MRLSRTAIGSTSFQSSTSLGQATDTRYFLLNSRSAADEESTWFSVAAAVGVSPPDLACPCCVRRSTWRVPACSGQSWPFTLQTADDHCTLPLNPAWRNPRITRHLRSRFLMKEHARQSLLRTPIASSKFREKRLPSNVHPPSPSRVVNFRRA